ncbi:MAG TPA: DedA family protein [Rhodospirillales bacterium]|nr:DedA family protein [Rhodospirillales bacterium]
MESLFGVFLSAFLAATILPFSSEAVLAAFYVSGGGEAVSLWAVATVGNVLGAVVNWGLGRYALHWQGHRWFPFSSQQLNRAKSWFARYGIWSLGFAWLPIIGDPLTFAAGMLRVRLSIFLILVTLGKAARYAVVLQAADALKN